MTSDAPLTTEQQEIGLRLQGYPRAFRSEATEPRRGSGKALKSALAEIDRAKRVEPPLLVSAWPVTDEEVEAWISEDWSGQRRTLSRHTAAALIWLKREFGGRR